MTPTFAHAVAATPGAREHQEDYCAVALAEPSLPTMEGFSPPSGDEFIAVLADGMGGHVAGARASVTACKSFIETYTGTDGLTRYRLANALGASNLAIAQEVHRDSALQGMGCTLIGAAFSTRGLRWVSVGDSPLFLFRDRRLYQLNADHSLAPILDRLAEQGEMSPDDALNHPHRHFLRSALTGQAIELIDLADNVLPLEPGDWVVIASDGIETLTHAQIANIIDDHKTGAPEALASAIIEAVEAEANPAQDNTTVMAVRPVFGGAACGQAPD